MKIIKRFGVLLGIGLLGFGGVAGVSQSATAAPSRSRPQYKTSQKSSQQNKYGRNNHRNDRNGYNNRNKNKRSNNRRDDHRFGNRSNQFVGTVAKVKSNQLFDIRIDNKIFNVYTASRLPRNLKVGDVVRVSGDRVGSNDIRNASVSRNNNRR